MDVDVSFEKIRMKKALVCTTQVCISLGPGWDYGQKAGLVVGLHGILLDAERENIRELQKMLLQSIA